LAEVDETESYPQDVAARPQGRLRIDAKPSIGTLVLIPALCDFHECYPDVELAIGLSDRKVDPGGIVSVNKWSAHLACGVQGFGIIQTARFMALPHIYKDELVEVLPRYRPAPVPISLLYLQSRQLSPKVRAFSD
jgi:DNA-binding transcriptional LysR family regulator